VSDEQIRIAIAEACGWVWYRMPKNSWSDYKLRCLFLPAVHEYKGQDPLWMVRADGTERVCNMKYMESEGHLPDYPNDLNAMHEAVRSIAVTNGHEFCMHLRSIVVRDCENDPLCTLDTGVVHDTYFYNATARQRAEAFLRTLNLWKP
jgi:hypothetical protein